MNPDKGSRDLESRMDNTYAILSELEKRVKITVNCKYLEIINGINDGINEILQTARLDADTFNNMIKSTISDMKEELTSSLNFKDEHEKKLSSPSPRNYSQGFDYSKYSVSNNNYERYVEAPRSASPAHSSINGKTDVLRREASNSSNSPQRMNMVGKLDPDSPQRMNNTMIKPQITDTLNHHAIKSQNVFARNEPKMKLKEEDESITTHVQVLPNGITIKEYGCKDCDYKTRYKNNLERHIRNQHSGKRLKAA